MIYCCTTKSIESLKIVVFNPETQSDSNERGLREVAIFKSLARRDAMICYTLSSVHPTLNGLACTFNSLAVPAYLLITPFP